MHARSKQNAEENKSVTDHMARPHIPVVLTLAIFNNLDLSSLAHKPHHYIASMLSRSKHATIPVIVHMAFLPCIRPEI